MKRATIIKLKELPDAACPDNMVVGYSHKGLYETEPVVGECFYIGTLRTSTVQEIIDEITFKTFNSIYQLTDIQDIFINSEEMQVYVKPEFNKSLDN